jgi:uncharacterized membrane protein YdjX (TVP38/TMEM64 family)
MVEMKKYTKWIPLAVIAILMVIAYAAGVADYFTYEMLQERHAALTQFVHNYYFSASAIFITTYIVSTALSLPIGIYLSFIGGYLFAQPWSLIYVTVGATIGASILFWAARIALKDFLKRKYSHKLAKMKEGFNENAANYLLFLRLVPIFPFWFVNLAPALLGVRFSTFVWTTAVGILPGVFVFTQFGAGIGSVLETGDDFSIESVFTTEIQIALAALAIFVLIPVIVKKIRKRKKND